MKAKQFVSHYDTTVASLSGRSVEFKKGVPVLVPPQMHAELMAMGIRSADETDEVDVDAEKSKPADTEPSDPAARETAMFAVFETMVLRDRRGDFMASGAPHGNVLAKELGWQPIQAKEREAAWAKWTQTRDGK